jgi:hypothetical protein
MTDILSQFPTELVPRGIYRVGNRVFDNKIQALIHGDAAGIHPTWDFHDDYFSKFDWTIEPAESLEQLYKLRCEQIRDKYNHIVLHFSGGSDSHNILSHFYKYNIHVDEILIAAPVEYYDKFTVANNSVEAKDMHNEWYHVLLPDIKWISDKMPATKITLYDYTNDMLNFEVDQDWILHVGEHFNPNVVNRIRRYDSINQDTYDKRNVGHVYGIDKPRLFKDNGHWYFAFLDSTLSIQSSHKPVFEKHNHINVENFYWSPDLPQMLIKQAHAVRSFFDANSQLLHLAKFSKTSHDDRAVYQDIVREIIYPFWRREIFQNKKANNIIFKEFDKWFFDLASSKAKGVWNDGYQYVINSINSKWVNYNELGKPNGIVGFWSRWHRLT